MSRERLFFTGSTNIIGDPRLSGLDLRVYACVSLHDGMSLLKKTGRGCYATFATLMAEIGCDAANLSKSLKRLVEWGYLIVERQEDRRRKTYRVVFETQESWQTRQQSSRPESWQNDQQSSGGIVGRTESGNGRIPPQTGQHYSSLKGLDFSEEKLNSPEGARLAARDHQLQVDHRLSDRVNLAKLARALRTGSPVDLVGWYAFLGQIDDYEDLAPAHIFRVSEVLAERMTQAELEAAHKRMG